MMVVPDTSPLLLLTKVGRLELLTTLYDDVVIPRAVFDEVEAKSQRDTQAIRHWCDQYSMSPRGTSAAYVEQLPDNLGRGERAAIGLSIEAGADLVVLDDREGRRVAQNKGLEVTGTVGVLIEARARGQVVSLPRQLDRLVEAGLWISEAFYERLIREFDEQ